jgi:hypothetical protein
MASVPAIHHKSSVSRNGGLLSFIGVLLPQFAAKHLLAIPRGPLATVLRRIIFSKRSGAGRHQGLQSQRSLDGASESFTS